MSVKNWEKCHEGAAHAQNSREYKRKSKDFNEWTTKKGSYFEIMMPYIMSRGIV